MQTYKLHNVKNFANSYKISKDRRNTLDNFPENVKDRIVSVINATGYE